MFFGVTHLGFQNYIREYSILAKEDSLRGSCQLGFRALPPLKNNDPFARSIVPVNQTSSYGPGHEGSFLEMRKMKIKHTRNPTGMVGISNKYMYKFIN